MWFHIHLIPVQEGTKVPTASWPAHETGYVPIQLSSQVHDAENRSFALSRHPIEIVFGTGTFFVRQLGSESATRVNGTQLVCGDDRPLLQGDLVELCRGPTTPYDRAFSFRVDLSRSSSSTPSFPGPYSHISATAPPQCAWLDDMRRTLDDITRQSGQGSACAPLTSAAFALGECIITTKSLFSRSPGDLLPATFSEVPAQSSTSFSISTAPLPLLASKADESSVAAAATPNTSVSNPTHPASADPSSAIASSSNPALASPVSFRYGDFVSGSRVDPIRCDDSSVSSFHSPDAQDAGLHAFSAVPPPTSEAAGNDVGDAFCENPCRQGADSVSDGTSCSHTTSVLTSGLAVEPQQRPSSSPAAPATDPTISCSSAGSIPSRTSVPASVLVAAAGSTLAGLGSALSQAQNTPALQMDARPAAAASAHTARSFRSAFIAIQRMQSAWVTARRDAHYVRKTRSVDIALRRLRAAFEQLSAKAIPTSAASSSPMLQDHSSASSPQPAPTVRESLPHTPTSFRSTTLASSEVHVRSSTAPCTPTAALHATSARPANLPSPAYFLAPLHALHHILNTVAFQTFNSSHAYPNNNYQLQLSSPFLVPSCSALAPIPFH